MVRVVDCCNEVELSCSMRTDYAERGSRCSESEQSGTILFLCTDCVQIGSHCSESLRRGSILFCVHGLRSAGLALLSGVTKWNYLVMFARTAFSAVYIVESRNEVELTCSVHLDCVQHGSYC